MALDQWLTVGGTVVSLIGSGVVGYFIKYFLDKKAQFTSKNAEVKREMYQKFVDLALSFFLKTKANRRLQANAVDELAEFYKKYVLYASPKVIDAFSEFMQFFYARNKIEGEEASLTHKQTKQLLRMMTKIYKEMRKDIGLSNRGLGRDGERLMRAIITDYDDVMHPLWLTRTKLFTKVFRTEYTKKMEANATKVKGKTVLSEDQDMAKDRLGELQDKDETTGMVSSGLSKRKTKNRRKNK